MATWSLCTKFGNEQQKQKVFINLDNVITVERLDDRTTIVFVNGGMEILETAADDVIRPYQVSGHAPLIAISRSPDRTWSKLNVCHLLFVADMPRSTPPQRPRRQSRAGCYRERQGLVDVGWTIPPYVPMMRHGPARHGRRPLSIPAPCLLPDLRVVRIAP